MRPQKLFAGDAITASWLQKLFDWIETEIKPVGDNKTIAVNGNVISALGQAQQTTIFEKYDGSFTVKLTTNTLDPTIRQLLVCNPSAVFNKNIAGEIESSSGDGVTVPETRLPLDAGYVYLKIQADGDALTAEIVQSKTKLNSTTYIEYVQLAQVECDEYGSTQVGQIWRSGNVRINYRWW